MTSLPSVRYNGLANRARDCARRIQKPGRDSMRRTYPRAVCALLLALLMLSFNLVGDGLREALNPKMKDM